MSLRIKYVIVLNGIIMAMWILYTVWTLKETERQFMKAEVGSLKHLAIGLTLLVEHQLAHHESTEMLQTEIASLLPATSGYDFMVIDRSFQVKLATQPALVGERWFEETIRDVLNRQTSRHEVIVTNEGHRHENRRAIDATVAVRSPSGEINHAIHVAKWLDQLSGALNQQLLSHGLFALAMLIIVGAAVNLLTYQVILKPLQQMNRSLVQSGWLSSHPELQGGSELKQLQAVLKDTLNRIADHTTNLNEQLARSERLAVIGQMASMLAHEIRNPMHIIRGTAETICRRFPKSGEFGQDIREEVDRVEHLIEELLDYARDTSPRFETITATDLLTSAAIRVRKSLTADTASTSKIRTHPSDITLDADPVMMEQALTNLLINAVEASTNDSPIDMRATEITKDRILFEIVDSGVGIAEDDLEKTVKPFFTRKAKGTGLGLAVVEKIVDLHSGALTLRRRPEGGTAASLILPKQLKRGQI